MRNSGSIICGFIAMVLLGVSLASGEVTARDRLTEIGARLSAESIDKSKVTVFRTVTSGADVITGTFVTAHTASGRALQRNHLGFWVPWDGRLSSMADNRFAVADGRITFKVLKDEDMSAELFPVRITLAYRTQSALKFGVFELRESGLGIGQ